MAGMETQAQTAATSATALLREQLDSLRRTHPLQEVVLDGVRWNYVAAGDGSETLFILPGLLGVAEMSFQHILGLEDTYHVITPNYPARAANLETLVQGLARIVEREAGAGGRVHVLGNSYGGLVAQVLVHRYPYCVDRLVLSHTGVPDPTRLPTNRRVLTLLRLLPAAVTRALLKSVTRRTLAGLEDSLAFWETYTNEVIAGLGKQDLVSRYAVAVDLDATQHYAPQDLDAWPGRILILQGADDPVVEVASRAALRALYPHAQVHTFDEMGHIASIARVDEYLAVIRRFLSEA